MVSMQPLSLNAAARQVPLRAVVGMESQEDFRLFFRLAKILHRSDRSLPDLQKHAKAGEVMCIPFGLQPRGFIEMFLTVDVPQLYLFGRGTGSVSDDQRDLMRRICRRGDCSAVVLRKRAMPNYLHAAAIYEEYRASVSVQDDNDVPVEVVQHVLKPMKFPAWDQLDPQLRADLAAAMAIELSIKASRRMTAERLAQRDPDGEVAGWLRMIGTALNRF
ncbi:MAG: hypothetical protein JNM56_00705 [Planctomycetia bacterium]|nr:hypothetical protein [Planctomycetia bacterium]